MAFARTMISHRFFNSMRFGRFLNSRFVSALCAATVLLAGAWVGVRPLRNFFAFREGENFRQVEALARLQLMSFSEVSTPDDHVQKFVGKIRNNSSALVTSVTGAVGFYDETKTLKDLFTGRLEGVSLLKPGEEVEFAIVRSNERSQAGSKPVKTVSSHVELKFVDIAIAESAP